MARALPLLKSQVLIATVEKGGFFSVVVLSLLVNQIALVVSVTYRMLFDCYISNALLLWCFHWGVIHTKAKTVRILWLVYVVMESLER